MMRIRKEKDQGFTLIELLVVMIIIGILAAVAIPVFLSQRAKAEDAAAKADVSTLGKEIATFFVDAGPGDEALIVLNGAGTQYYMNDASDPDNLLGNVSNNVVLVDPGPFDSATTWCVEVINTEGSIQTFSYSAREGLQPDPC